MIRAFFTIFLCVWFAWPLSAATYYVTITGNNSNNGSEAAPWRTIQHAANQAVGGDNVRIALGAYDEEVDLPNSGSSGNWINFIGSTTGTGVVSTKFTLANKSFIRLIGLELRHPNYQPARRRVVEMSGGTHDIMILDCYLHNNEWAVIQGIGSCYNITVRGNVINEGGIPGGTPVFGEVAVGFDPSVGVINHHLLIEYNVSFRNADGFYPFGRTNIMRNNWHSDVQNSYWPEFPHFDGAQPGSDCIPGQCDAQSQNQIYEANLIGDLISDDAHFSIHQDQAMVGDSNILMRLNVGYRIGTGGTGAIGTRGMRCLNNTFFGTPWTNNGGVFTFHAPGDNFALSPSNIMVINNIMADDGVGNNEAIGIEPECTSTVYNNLGWRISGSSTSYVSTAYPEFVNTNTPLFTPPDLRITGSSPAINMGYTNICNITSGNGSGTSFNVTMPWVFTDGWGMVEGDQVIINGTVTRITGISGFTLTVADSVTWTTGAAVILGRDMTPALGAYPDDADFVLGGILSQNGTTYTVTSIGGDSGDVRGVWFYVDDIPFLVDYDAPFEQTIIGSNVRAKIMARHAQPWPIRECSLVQGGSPQKKTRSPGRTVSGGRRR